MGEGGGVIRTSESRPCRKIEREAPRSSSTLATGSLPHRSASESGVSCFVLAISERERGGVRERG